MKIFTASQIRAADAYTIKHEPISSIDLMERAAQQLADWIAAQYHKKSSFKIFLGPGNNGGDGWALARMLRKVGYSNVFVNLLSISDKLSPDSEINRTRLTDESNVKVIELHSKKDFPKIDTHDIVIDALFGSGLSRPLEGLAAELINYINNSQASDVIAIDIPSGLFAEANSGSGTVAMQASVTLSFQFPKLAFFFPENEACLGKWYILPIGLHPEFIASENTHFNFSEGDKVARLIKKRKKFSHKGTYGHGLLIAGSYGMMGAAVLAAKGAMRAGAGLITSHVPRMAVDTMQIAVPEVLISIDESDILFSEHPPLEIFSAIAVGPGLNQKTNTRKAFIDLLKDTKVPLVIDADGLNILSQLENWKELLPENSILTPHPREFERLFGSFDNSYSRLMAQKDFSVSTGCTIILKQAHTCITLPDGSVFFNSTGNPGMATGGSGDVLTGLIIGLLAQGYTSTDASILAVYLHGLAGDIGVHKSHFNALIASDIADNIGAAFGVIEDRNTKL